jgi:hypothetical protein
MINHSCILARPVILLMSKCALKICGEKGHALLMPRDSGGMEIVVPDDLTLNSVSIATGGIRMHSHQICRVESTTSIRYERIPAAAGLER